jgi:outer membrane protein OmpA-like peptidoglycan-associated protein
MSAMTYGKEKPLCAESTEACWSRNRRVHFLLK